MVRTAVTVDNGCGSKADTRRVRRNSVCGPQTLDDAADTFYHSPVLQFLVSSRGRKRWTTTDFSRSRIGRRE